MILPTLLLAFAQSPAPQAPAAAPETPLRVGNDAVRFHWVRDWARLPERSAFGNTHGGLAVDARGRIYVNTDTESAVMVFEPDGKLAGAWGKEFRGGSHGMVIRARPPAPGEKADPGSEPRQELVLAHTARHEVVGTTLDGEVLWTLGWPRESGLYAAAEEYHPTAVAFAPDGRLFVADGYGKSWVHVYDAQRKYVSSFGGPGEAPGKFRTPHGLFMDAAHAPPRLIVADRENHRLQCFGLDLALLEVVDHDLRRPCGLARHGERYAVADLAGRVTVFDAKFQVLAQLCDQPDESLRAQNGVPREKWKDGEFVSPHAVCFDAAGNLYVMDWVSTGRVTKLAAAP